MYMHPDRHERFIFGQIHVLFWILRNDFCLNIAGCRMILDPSICLTGLKPLKNRKSSYCTTLRSSNTILVYIFEKSNVLMTIWRRGGKKEGNKYVYIYE